MISIILPTYNRAPILSSAIDSVLGQTFKQFELIVVDDGSTDHTKELVLSYTDQRVNYLQVPRSGANAARNAGIKQAAFDVVGFQDSDAKWQPDKLEKQYSLLQGLPADYAGVFSAALVEKKPGQTRRFPKFMIREETLYQNLLHENFIDTPALLIKKEALIKAGMFDEQLLRFQDWELALRLSKKYRLFFINEALHISLAAEEKITADERAGLRSKIYIFRTYYQDISQNKPTLANHYYSLGLSLAALKRNYLARKYFWKALSLNPFHIKAWIRLVMARKNLLTKQDK